MSSGQKNNHELNIRHGNAIIQQMLLSRAIRVKEGCSEAFKMIIGSKTVFKEKLHAAKDCGNKEEEADEERII